MARCEWTQIRYDGISEQPRKESAICSCAVPENYVIACWIHRVVFSFLGFRKALVLLISYTHPKGNSTNYHF